MSAQTDVLRQLCARFNERAPIEVERYFTPDFELDDPGSGARRSGHEGARAMANALAGLGDSVRLEILDIIEERDLVAVRYAVTTRTGEPDIGAMIAFYRFVDGRIAEDWGVSTRAAWRR